ncbi:hypothetical protein [Streptomyces sp. NBC_00878]|uniref:hypothetical protein n=1 Tax=Streptomyces sp. NBC_00878 TaxID=2975854 RepID=UPI002252CAF8|nr:hypothetical protein [Streptomyces sp. NBC_00878]MCX4911911.1 hypothetical protein [Streptomyces sp. NBC_00878]
MPVYETQSELDAAEAAYRRADAIERACKASGQPCEHIGNHHVEEKHRRGLHLRAANGMFHSGIRSWLPVHGCRWCGREENAHCGGYSVGSRKRQLHTWEQPTPAQIRARCIAHGLDPDNPPPLPAPYAPPTSECRCDRGDEDAEPCDAEDCCITELLEIGVPH